MMYTGKVDHKFTDKVSLTGFYLYNKTDEPCANYWEPGLNGPNRYADPGDYILERRVNVLALEQHLAAEQQHGADAPLRPDQVHGRQHAVDRLRPVDARLQPDLPRPDRRWRSTRRCEPPSTATRAPSTRRPATGTRGAPTAPTRSLVGKHTLKVGGDYRLIGIETQSFARQRRVLLLRPLLHLVEPAQQRHRRHHASRQRAGLDAARLSHGACGGSEPRELRQPDVGPFDAYVHYFGGYAQDDWRISPKTTINLRRAPRARDRAARGEQRLHRRVRPRR